MIEFLKTHWNDILGWTIGGSGFGMYFLERRKSKKQIEAAELENIEKGLGIYRQMLDDMEKRFREEIQQLTKKIDHLEEELAECRKLHS